MKPVSRQRAWQLKKLSQGLCQICGKEKVLTGSYGPRCLLKSNQLGREKLGYEPFDDEKGRPSYYTDEQLKAIINDSKRNSRR